MYQVSFSLRQVSLPAAVCFANFCSMECEIKKDIIHRCKEAGGAAWSNAVHRIGNSVVLTCFFFIISIL